MPASRLRHFIVLQSKSVTGRDSMGGEIFDWIEDDPSPVAAEVEPKGGRRFFAALQEHAEDDIIFRIRWHPRIQPTWRVLWEDRAYKIEEIKEGPNAKHREQYVRCTTMQHAEELNG